jgi:hypothetical protein
MRDGGRSKAHKKEPYRARLSEEFLEFREARQDRKLSDTLALLSVYDYNRQDHYNTYSTTDSRVLEGSPSDLLGISRGL